MQRQLLLLHGCVCILTGSAARVLDDLEGMVALKGNGRTTTHTLTHTTFVFLSPTHTLTHTTPSPHTLAIADITRIRRERGELRECKRWVDEEMARAGRPSTGMHAYQIRVHLAELDECIATMEKFLVA